MRFIIALSLLAMLAACQSEPPRALDPAAILRTWREASPASPPVAQYARELWQRQSAPATRPYNPDDGIDLPEAEVLALFYNAELRRIRLDAAVAAAGAAEAGRWEDPRLGIDAERFLSGSPDRWVTVGTLSLTLPLSGRLQLERDSAQATAWAKTCAALASERQTILDLRLAWAAWSATSERILVLQSAVDELDRLRAAGDRLRAAGELTPSQARVFAIDLQRKRTDLLEARRDARRHEAEIRELIGLAPTTPLLLTPTLDLAPPVPAADSDPDDRHPLIAAARADYDVAERTLALAIARQYPDLQIAPGLGRDQGDGKVLLGLSLPLPIFNANRREIAEARASRESARSAYESRLRTLAAGTARSRREAADAAEIVDSVRDALMPLVDRQLAETRRLLEAGELDPLLMRDAADAATDAKLRLVDAGLAAAQARARLRWHTESAMPPSSQKESRP